VILLNKQTRLTTTIKKKMLTTKPIRSLPSVELCFAFFGSSDSPPSGGGTFSPVFLLTQFSEKGPSTASDPFGHSLH